MPYAWLNEANFLIDHIRRSDAGDELTRNIVSQLQRFGLTHFKVTELHESGNPALARVAAGNWPGDWSAWYFGQQYHLIDPFGSRLMSGAVAVRRREVCEEPGTPPLVQRIADGEREFGLADFVSVPIRRQGVTVGVVCAAGPTEVLTGPTGLLIQLIAPALYDQAVAAGPPQMYPKRRGQKLTRREIDCLSWCARGKTSWETGEILGVSEHTVTTHLRSAGIKLNATTRTHAVAEAIRRGMIS